MCYGNAFKNVTILYLIRFLLTFLRKCNYILTLLINVTKKSYKI